jgi:hypothetical protein
MNRVRGQVSSILKIRVLKSDIFFRIIFKERVLKKKEYRQ